MHRRQGEKFAASAGRAPASRRLRGGSSAPTLPKPLVTVRGKAAAPLRCARRSLCPARQLRASVRRHPEAAVSPAPPGGGGSIEGGCLRFPRRRFSPSCFLLFNAPTEIRGGSAHGCVSVKERCSPHALRPSLPLLLAGEAVRGCGAARCQRTAVEEKRV